MTLGNALKTRDFVVTGQLNLANAQDADALLRQGDVLRRAVDAVQLLDSKQPHISGLAAAALLIGDGVDPVVHMNCRDRNRLALQKDLLGAAALGVGSVLIARGAKIPKSASVGVRNVFDTPALEFMAYIQGLKLDDGEKRLSPDFLIGANAEMFGPERGWVPKNLIRKCDAGANFVQLQICFDMDVARRYMARIVAAKLTHRASFIMGLSPLPSAEAARWIRENVKGALVPDSIVRRLELASDPESEGVDICAALLREASTIPGVSGVNLLTLGNLETIPAAVEASGLRRYGNL